MRWTEVSMRIVTGLVLLLGATAQAALAQSLADREARLRALVPYERMVAISPGTTRAEYDEVMRDLAREQVARGVEREAASNQGRAVRETRQEPERRRPTGIPVPTHQSLAPRPQPPISRPQPPTPSLQSERRDNDERSRRDERGDRDGRRDRDDNHHSKSDEPAAVYTPASYTPPTYKPATYTPPSYTPPSYTPSVYTPPTYGAAPTPQAKPDRDRGRDDRDEGRQRYVDPRTGRVCVADRGVLFCS